MIADTEKVYKQVINTIAKEHGKVYTEEMRLKLMGSPDTVASQVCVKDMKLPMTTEQFLKEFRNRSYKLIGSCPYMPGTKE